MCLVRYTFLKYFEMKACMQTKSGTIRCCISFFSLAKKFKITLLQQQHKGVIRL